MQFALDGPEEPHWPHNYEPNCACYTGTHDNDTVERLVRDAQRPRPELPRHDARARARRPGVGLDPRWRGLRWR